MPASWIKRLRDPETGRFMATSRAPALKWKHRFRGGEVDVELNTAAVRVFCLNQLRGLLKDVCADAVKGAKLRVRPGVGPGPHPHRTDHGWVWEDTGNLERAIGYGFEELTGNTEAQAVVYVDASIAPYGLWLELGWHGPSGRLYRYPFLVPAIQHSMRNSSRYVRLIGALSYATGRV